MTTTENQSASDAVTAGSHATDIARSGAATFRSGGGSEPDKDPLSLAPRGARCWAASTAACTPTSSRTG